MVSLDADMMDVEISKLTSPSRQEHRLSLALPPIDQVAVSVFSSCQFYTVFILSIDILYSRRYRVDLIHIFASCKCDSLAPMAPPVSFTKATLSYPIYSVDFDPYNRGFLVVGGGGGEGRSGVSNKIVGLQL